MSAPLAYHLPIALPATLPAPAATAPAPHPDSAPGQYTYVGRSEWKGSPGSGSLYGNGLARVSAGTRFEDAVAAAQQIAKAPTGDGWATQGITQGENGVFYIEPVGAMEDDPTDCSSFNLADDFQGQPAQYAASADGGLKALVDATHWVNFTAEQ